MEKIGYAPRRNLYPWLARSIDSHIADYEEGCNSLLHGGIYLMNNLKLISLLVVCTLISLPRVAKASDIDLQTDSTRVTVGADSGIKIEPRGVATSYPNQWRSPAYYRRNWGRKNCNSVRLNQRSYQTSSSGSGVAQTSSYTSTRVCR